MFHKWVRKDLAYYSDITVSRSSFEASGQSGEHSFGGMDSRLLPRVFAVFK